MLVQVEVLSADRRSKGTDGLAGSSPEARQHIDGEGEGDESSHDAEYGHWLAGTANLVLLELQPSYEVGAEHGEDDNP